MKRLYSVCIAMLAMAGCQSELSYVVNDGEECREDCGDLTCCGGECIDLSKDIHHCGSCGTRCRNNQTCIKSQCQSQKQPDPIETVCDDCNLPNVCCNGECVAIKNDISHCGSCTIKCEEGQSCIDGACQDPCHCPEGEDCREDGTCAPKCGSVLCEIGETCCSGQCASLDSTEHCGSCDTPCKDDEPYCSGGECTAECTPKTCGQMEAECGVANDGCGSQLDCGPCQDGKVCQSNRCQEACTPVSCETAGKNCGFIDDGCGGQLGCGECQGTQICQNNICIDQAACQPSTCQSENKECGIIDDGCESTLDCGSCPGGKACVSNHCEDQAAPCTPTTCEAKKKNCGDMDNGCGVKINCGSCTGTKTCQGNVCTEPPCTPTTCATKGKNCGEIDDGCGGKLKCGSCSGNQTCSGNVCKDPACTPTTCKAQGKNCGSISDGCGKTLQCGNCPSNQTCSGNVCKDKPTSIKDTYPTRKSIKGIQPDFQDTSQIIGNQIHGVAMNMVWEFWQPSQKGSCSAGQVAYDGNCFTIQQETVNAIKKYTDNGIVVTAVVYGVPAWARGATSGKAVAPMFYAPASGKGKDYGRFAGFLAHYFNGENGHGRIADFVIHNEVNSYMWFNPGTCTSLSNCNLDSWVARYAESYNSAYDYIRKEQKQAKVLISFDHFFGSSGPIEVSVTSFLGKLVPQLGSREWMLAYHSYPPSLTKPAFGANDYFNGGRVTFGNIGVIVGWLRKTYPSDPHAWEVQLTENGINGVGASMQAQQKTQLCQALRNILGTPGITSLIYHRLVDHPDEVKDGLGCGLWNSNGSPKPAWELYCYANRKDIAGYPSCGFELLPYTKMMRGFGNGMHYVTSRQFPPNVNAERSWKLLRDKAADTQMVYECRIGQGHTFPSLDANCEGQFSMGPMGYIYTKQVSGTSPVYRCIIPAASDHFISPDPNCEGQVVENGGQPLGYAIPL